MGIVVTKDSLRPYTNVPTEEADPEMGHTSINVSVPFPNGVSSKHAQTFTSQRWETVLGRAQSNRQPLKGNGR